MQARRGPAFRGRAPSFSPCWIGGGRGRLPSLPAKGRPQRKRAIGACLARSWTPTPLRRPLGAGFCRSPSLVGRGAVRCRREGGSAPAPVWGGWLLGRRPKNAFRLREVGREAVRFPRVAVPLLDQARGLRGQVRRACPWPLMVTAPTLPPPRRPPAWTRSSTAPGGYRSGAGRPAPGRRQPGPERFRERPRPATVLPVGGPPLTSLSPWRTRPTGPPLSRPVRFAASADRFRQGAGKPRSVSTTSAAASTAPPPTADRKSVV